MPYLSKIPLNPLRRGAQLLLSNPHRTHAAVLGGLARQPVRERVLWRMEPNPHRCDLLVLTQSRPSWEALVEQAGWADADDGDAIVRDYDPLLSQIVAGRQFAFRLRANPVMATRNIEAPTASQKQYLADPSNRRGIRAGHRTVNHQLTWFLDRAADDANRWGFSVGPRNGAAVALTQRGHESFSKTNGGARVQLDVATYDGTLTVVDPTALRSVLLSGVGRAKAYGCGLLTLAPARR